MTYQNVSKFTIILEYMETKIIFCFTFHFKLLWIYLWYLDGRICSSQCWYKSLIPKQWYTNWLLKGAWTINSNFDHFVLVLNYYIFRIALSITYLYVHMPPRYIVCVKVEHSCMVVGAKYSAFFHQKVSNFLWGAIPAMEKIFLRPKIEV